MVRLRARSQDSDGDWIIEAHRPSREPTAHSACPDHVFLTFLTTLSHHYFPKDKFKRLPEVKNKKKGISPEWNILIFHSFFDLLMLFILKHKWDVSLKRSKSVTLG